RDRVEVRAQQHRAPAAAAAREARQQVAAVGADRLAGAVLADLEAERRELGAGSLAQRRAVDRAQLGEDRMQVALLQRAGGRVPGGVERALGRPPPLGAVTRHDRAVLSPATPAADARVSETRSSCAAPRSLPRSIAAATNSRNIGAGRSGRDLNSGWTWEAT